MKLFKNKDENLYFKQVVLLNTAACLVISEKAKNLINGIEIANKNIINGNALKKLNQLVSSSNE